MKDTEISEETKGAGPGSPALIESLKLEKAELKRLLEGYRRAIEISLDAMVAADESGRVTLWNPAAERLFGYSKQEAVGMNVELFVPEDLREKHREGMERFLGTGQGAIIGHVVEVEGLRSDGSRVSVEMSLSAEKVGGRWVFMAIIRDDTARRGLEEELKARLLEMERLAKLMVGREIRMGDLRREIAGLRKKAADGA